MSRDWRRANWWDYPDDDTPGVIEEDQTIQEIMLDQGIEGPQTQMQGSGIMQLAGGEYNRVLELLEKVREGGPLSEEEKIELQQLIRTLTAKGIDVEKLIRSPSGEMRTASADPMLQDEYDKYVFELQEMHPEATPMSIEQFKQENMAGGMAKKINPDVSIEEVVKEFIREKGRKPNSLDELKEFYEISVGTAKASPEMDTVKELIEEDKTKITLASGGLAGILGV